jgi:YHS domain-containing protein
MNRKYLALAAAAGLLTLGLGSSLRASVAETVADPTVIQDLAQAQTTRFPAVYTENGLALDGQDVVAYFTQSEVVAGNPQFAHSWNGAMWQFASAENRDLFAQNPEAYAPQYGGYCAKAAAGGVLATTVPTAWQVIDGKLYLNYSAAAQMEFMVDTPTKIRMANANWPAILNNDDLKE